MSKTDRQLRMYSYIGRDDYDKTYAVGIKKITCFSKKELDAAYPDGNYRIVGETADDLKKSDKNIAVLNVARTVLNVNAFGNHSKLYRAAKFIQVGENEFIALLELRAALIWIPAIGAAAVIAAIVIALVVNGNNVEPAPSPDPDPQEEDPNIKPIESDEINVSGTVTLGTTARENESVILYAGSDVVQTTSTDKTGKYLFNKVAAGLYNVTATVNGSTLTKRVLVVAASVVVDFSFPELDGGTVATVVKINDSSTPDIAVGELDEEVLIHALSGKDVTLTFIPKKNDVANVPQADSKSISEKSGELALTYFDFSMLKEVTSDNKVESSEYLKQTNTVLEVVIPYSTIYDADTRVYRSIDGVSSELTKLESQPTTGFKDGTCYISNDYIYIYTSKMGTFAIGSAKTESKVKGSAVISYESSATANMTTGKISMRYDHGENSATSARIELYLVGDTGNLLISESGIIPAGYTLTEMTLKSGLSGLPGVGTYEGLMTVIYINGSGDSVDLNIDIPLTVTLVK